MPILAARDQEAVRKEFRRIQGPVKLSLGMGAATLPSSLKIRAQEGEFLLEQAMEPHLPDDIQDYLRHLVDAHQSGARDYSAPLWTLLMFEAFLRNVLDASTPIPVEQAEAVVLS
jgi:asparagine synthase (glutamine-hydrolysing)